MTKVPQGPEEIQIWLSAYVAAFVAIHQARFKVWCYDSAAEDFAPEGIGLDAAEVADLAVIQYREVFSSRSKP